MSGFYRRERLFCPGPTPVPLQVALHGVESSVYHRSAEFEETVIVCREQLAKFMGSSSLPVLLTSSGTGAMEAAVTNFTEEGDSVLCIVAGKFGERWAQLASNYGCNVRCLEVNWGSAPTPSEVCVALEDIASPKAVFLQANETSTGVFLPVAEISAAIKARFPGCLVVVDAVSALVAHEIRMDEWDIDILVGGSQKGFGIPPGLAFIAISELAQQHFSGRRRYYFELQRELKGQRNGQTAWTPAASLIAMLRQSLDILMKAGPAQVAQQHAKLAHMTRSAFSSIGLKMLASNNYSHAVTAVLVPDSVDLKKFLAVARQDFGVVLSGGQGKLSGKIFRFAHLGFVDAPELLGGICAVELALRQSGSQHALGLGAQAALESYESS